MHTTAHLTALVLAPVVCPAEIVVAPAGAPDCGCGWGDFCDRTAAALVARALVEGAHRSGRPDAFGAAIAQVAADGFAPAVADAVRTLEAVSAEWAARLAAN